MTHHDAACFDAFKRVGNFGTTNTADFAGTDVVSVKARALFTELDGVVTGLTAATGGQITGAGASSAGTTSKATQRQLLLATMRSIHKSAEAIAAAQHKPEIMDKFRLTYGENDTTLAANALAFATAAQPLEAAFLELGHAPDFIQSLKDEGAAFKAADDDQNIGAQARSGATKSIEPLVRQGTTALKQLDALMHNKYAANAEKLGAWLTASHIEKASHKAKSPAQPATAG